jgi:tellurite methyltransferase
MKSYWDKYYKKLKGNSRPTKFAISIRSFLKKYQGDIYDIGCGNARDTVFFNRNKLNCIGIDQSREVINRNKKSFKIYKNKFIKKNFIKLNYFNPKKNYSIYSRFSIHSVSKEEENEFFKNLKKLKKLQYLFIEVRTIYDELYGVGKKVAKNAYVTDHYRRFINPIDFKKKLKKDFKILKFKVSKNLAPFKNENPKVLRVIAKRKK